MSICLYYRAYVLKKDCWFLVAILRSFEHMAFDRTIDKESSLFEFYVPRSNQRCFLELMDYFQKNGLVLDLKECTNRLQHPNAKV